jgi:hypothetical protein
MLPANELVVAAACKAKLHIIATIYRKYFIILALTRNRAPCRQR